MKAKRVIANLVTTLVVIFLFTTWSRATSNELHRLNLEFFQGWIGKSLGVALVVLVWYLVLFLLWIWDLLKRGDEK